jgi:peptidyl-prolyl cis-trans isomerase D
VPLSKDKLSEEEIMASYDETKYFYRDDENRILEYAEVKKDVENALRVKNAEQDALRVYLSFKKGERTADKNITVKESSSEYDTSLFLAMSEGETLHPIQKENGWEVLKLISVIAPSPKSYEEARAQIIPILKANKRVELLAQKSLSNLNSFKGTDLGFVTRDESNITGLTTEQSRQFINTVFSSRDKRGYVILGDKAYLYNILEQRLPNSNKLAQNDADLENAIKQIRESEIRQKLISTLKPRYKIQQY